MSGRSLTLFVLAFSLATVGMASTIKDEATLKEIADYRDWPRVTQKPIAVNFSMAGG